MIIMSLLFLAVMAFSITFWLKNRVTTGNRYRRKKRAAVETTQKPAETTETVEQMDDDFIDDDDVLGLKPVESKPSVSDEKIKAKKPESNFTVILYLMAPENHVYGGYELLQALLSAGLRYGQHRIFHRHTHKDGRGDVLFHCASAMQPGFFDLTQIGSFSSRGLSLFYAVDDVEDPLGTFDCLLETIDQLVEDLGGYVLDDTKTLLTKDRMVKYRQQIRQFETGKVTTDMFA